MLNLKDGKWNFGAAVNKIHFAGGPGLGLVVDLGLDVNIQEATCYKCIIFSELHPFTVTFPDTLSQGAAVVGKD
jgi:hypothetical protein